MTSTGLNNFYVHESAYVDQGVVFGSGSKVWHFCHISPRVVIGENSSLGHACFVGSDVEIGKGVKIQNHVSVFSGVNIKDYVFIGPNVCFTNVLEPRANLDKKDQFLTTTIGHGASIGANATIICCVEVGEYAFIGAGAVLTKDAPAFSKIVGNPGRQIGWVDMSGNDLEFGEGGSSRAVDALGNCYTLNCGVVALVDR